MVTRRSTRIASGVNVMSPPSLWKVDSRLPCAFEIPPIWYTKSMCQVARRNSPSVTDWSPASCCSATASRTARSSTARSSSAEIVPAARSLPGRVQPRRPQQAPDMIGAERRSCPR